MNDACKAIPSFYKNTLFRSKAEAKFAVFLDGLNIKWSYEVDGYLLENKSCYLPDFSYKSQKIFIEIKVQEPDLEDIVKMETLARAKDAYVFCAVDPFGDINNVRMTLYQPNGTTLIGYEFCYSADRGIFIGNSGNCSEYKIKNDVVARAHLQAKNARFDHGMKPGNTVFSDKQTTIDNLFSRDNSMDLYNTEYKPRFMQIFNLFKEFCLTKNKIDKDEFKCYAKDKNLGDKEIKDISVFFSNFLGMGVLDNGKTSSKPLAKLKSNFFVITPELKKIMEDYDKFKRFLQVFDQGAYYSELRKGKQKVVIRKRICVPEVRNFLINEYKFDINILQKRVDNMYGMVDENEIFDDKNGELKVDENEIFDELKENQELISKFKKEKQLRAERVIKEELDNFEQSLRNELRANF